MMKCRTCKHWTAEKYGLGSCTGIFPSYTVISKPPKIDRKRGTTQKQSKLIRVRDGIGGKGKHQPSLASVVSTSSDWGCKNWERKSYD